MSHVVVGPVYDNVKIGEVVAVDEMAIALPQRELSYANQYDPTAPIRQSLSLQALSQACKLEFSVLQLRVPSLKVELEGTWRWAAVVAVLVGSPENT